MRPRKYQVVKGEAILERVTKALGQLPTERIIEKLEIYKRKSRWLASDVYGWIKELRAGDAYYWRGADLSFLGGLLKLGDCSISALQISMELRELIREPIRTKEQVVLRMSIPVIAMAILEDEDEYRKLTQEVDLELGLSK